MLERLLRDIRACTLCRDTLPEAPNPIVRADHRAPILIAGQAPGRKVHETGRPFNDPSGVRLRDWLGVTEDQFYNQRLFSFVPMGFCYPGRHPSGSGDAPPDPRCAKTWHHQLIPLLSGRELTVVIGRYAIDYHLNGCFRKASTLKEIVQKHACFWPSHVPLPHPSPRNILWFRRNPWFEELVIPRLRERVASLIQTAKR